MKRARIGSPGSGYAGPRAGSDPAVQMNEAGNRELLLTGEAARGLAGDASRGIVGAVRIAPLAPGVIDANRVSRYKFRSNLVFENDSGNQAKIPLETLS